ncbi:MAG TPA: hypothetical protein PLM79_14785 [Syntrophobacteraceae bacterium]|nr:hypothetical protein [Syntrophobacteraceae bacterium]
MEPGKELIVAARVRLAAKLPKRYDGLCDFRLTARLRTMESHGDAVEKRVPIVGPKKASMGREDGEGFHS